MLARAAGLVVLLPRNVALIVEALKALVPGDPVEDVRGVGARRGKVLRDAGIETVGDLLLRVPRRYLDRSTVLPIAQLPVGGEASVIGTVVRSHSPSFSRGRSRRPVPTTVDVGDETGLLQCVWFQGGQYIKMQPGDLIALSGRVDSFRGQPQMSHPDYETIAEAGDQPLLHTAGIIPLYATTSDMKERGLRSRGFRNVVRAALDNYLHHIRDPIGCDERRRLGLLEICDSLRAIHFPESLEEMKEARKRLAFEEFLALQIALLRQRSATHPTCDSKNYISDSKTLVPNLLDAINIKPTKAQQRALSEIYGDLAGELPMRRLLHGEVGSGKTLVALCAMLTVVESGYQACLMAPTEILAEQHFHYLQAKLQPLGVSSVLLTGGQRKAVRGEVLTALKTGAAAVAVGTHALIQKKVRFAGLGLAVVDEQHRFGVVQRAELLRTDPHAHLLVMTATPIPRSLALTLYGDLDVSVLDEVPPGRLPVRTEMRSPDRRQLIFEFVADQLRHGGRAYVVYPIIDESEKSDLKSAIAASEELTAGPLQEFEVGLLHGRLPSAEKTNVMEAFARGELHALVATTVIEVGVDVPEATVMVIEHAERFGLAQLHQLRGRVGRGTEQSYCILIAHDVATDSATPARRRLEAFCATTDGFAIAKKDLEIRGPGEVLGIRQAGLPPLVIGDPLRDLELLQSAREEARRLLRIREQGENRP